MYTRLHDLFFQTFHLHTSQYFMCMCKDTQTKRRLNRKLYKKTSKPYYMENSVFITPEQKARVKAIAEYI